jgi:hypothetical protein
MAIDALHCNFDVGQRCAIEIMFLGSRGERFRGILEILALP